MTKRTPEERYRHAFWCWLLEHAEQKLPLHDGRKPGYWTRQSGSLPVSGVGFDYVLGRASTGLELYLQRDAAEENLAIFALLERQKEAIEAAFGAELVWAPLLNRTGCRVRFAIEEGGWEDPGSWPVAIPATVDAMVRFSAVLTDPVLACARQVLEDGR